MAYFRDTFKKSIKYPDVAGHHQRIYVELDSDFIKESCDGFCPECEQMLYCVVFQDTEDEWSQIYS